MSDPNGKDHAFRCYLFAIFKSDLEASGKPVNRSNESFFQFRNITIAEGHAIGTKGLQTNGNSAVIVLDSLLRTELLERIRPVGGKKTGSKAIGFQHHAPGHVIAPTVHSGTEDTKSETLLSKVSGDRESVRTCSNDGGI